MNSRSKYIGNVEVVVAPIIRNAEGNILLFKSTKWKGIYVLPGGHIDYGETAFEAVVRETKEEVGITVKPLYAVNVGELLFPKSFNRKAHLIFIHIVCEASTETIQLDGRELVEYQWLRPEEALKLNVGKSIASSIQNYIDGVRINLFSQR